MRAIPKKIFGNRNIVLPLSIVIGIAWEGPARFIEWATLPLLAIVMTVSTMGITGEIFRSPKMLIKNGLLGIAMSYLVQGGLLIAFAYLFIDEPSLRVGFIILAAVPPAVAVIPFSVFLGGDDSLSLMGTVGAYIGALLIMPFIAFIFLGTGFVTPLKLITTLLELIIGPMVVAHILVRMKVSPFIEPIKGYITNWGFFLVIYIMVALNREIFLNEPETLFRITLLGTAAILLAGFGTRIGGKKAGISPARITSFELLGTLKNYGLAGGLSLYFFDERTAVPATVISVLGILYFVLLGILEREKRASEK